MGMAPVFKSGYRLGAEKIFRDHLKIMSIDFNLVRQYNYPTTIRFGAGAVNELAPHLKQKGLTKPLIVTDPNVEELDFFKKIVNDISSQGISVEVFSDIHKNPVKS